MVLLAESLKDIGYDVCFITNEFVGFYDSNDKFWYKKGFRRYQQGKRFIFLVTLLNSLRSLYTVNADIYFQRAPGAITGIIALFCKLKKKTFCYMVASSQDVDRNYIRGANKRDRILYEHGLRNANTVFVQMKEFKKLLFRNHGIKSYFVRDGIKFPKNIQLHTQKRYITFIGGVRPVKNPENFIRLAKVFPGKPFLMIGGSLGDKKYYQSIKKLARREKNIVFKGHIKREKIGYYLSQSLVLINTSEREGLPNTITEAWSYGVPVIGLNINPDNLLNGDLGFYCKGDFNLMMDYLKELLNNPVIHKMMSDRCIKYVTTNHDIEKIGLEIDDILRTQLNKYYR